MRTLIIVIMLFSSLNNCPDNGKYEKYKKAYNYLNDCSHLIRFDKEICKDKSSIHFPINVITEIYPLSPLIFSSEIIEQEIIPNMDTKYNKMNRFVVEFEQNNYFKPYVDAKLKELFKYNDKSQLYVTFSKPRGNLLFAELAYNINKKEKVNSIEDIRRFNKSLGVLFIFDQDNDIKKVRMNVNQYD